MFKSARLRLTLWYLAILGTIVGLLSLVLYHILVSLRHTELQAVGPTVRRGIAQLFARDEGTLVVQIVVLDAGLLILASLGAYVLAGRTLAPIAQIMERQQRFAAAASHELRTPLTVLQSRLEVALLSHRTPEEYEQIIGQAVTEAQRMGRLVTDLLSLARVQPDAGALTLSLVDLRDIVREAVEGSRPLAERKSLQLEVRVPRSLLVQGDAVKLRQAVSTLIDNAMTYTPEGGSVHVSGGSQRHHVSVQVRDNGPGIAPEQLPHVFEPFYRVDRARSGEGSHIGLGLALAAWIVRAHSGQLAVESHLGAGSTFSMVLPEAT